MVRWVKLSVASSFGTLTTGRAIVGIGEAALAPAAFATLAAVFPPHRRGLAISIFMVGLASGNGSSLLLGGWLFDAAGSGAFTGWPVLDGLALWRVVLLLSGAPALLVAPLLFTMREPKRQPSPAQTATVFGAVKRIAGDPRRLWLLYGALAFIGIAEFAFTAWKPTLFVRRFAYTPGQAGQLLGTITLLLAVFVTLLSGLVSDRLYRKHGVAGRLALMTGRLLLAGLSVPMVALGGEQLALVGVVFTTTGLGIGATTGIVIVQELLPDALRGFGSGLLLFVIILFGFSLGPTLVASLTDGVFEDPKAIGSSIAIVVAAAALVGAFALRSMAVRLPSATEAPQKRVLAESTVPAGPEQHQGAK